MKKKIFAPTLYPLNRDLSKTWFVKYYNKAGKPVKVYGKLAWYNTVKEKEEEAAKIIQKIFNPLFNDETVTDYVGRLSNHLEYKKPFLRPKSYESYFSIIKQFAVWYRVERKDNKNTAPSDYIRHLHNQQLHRNTIRNTLMCLKGLSKEILKKGEITSNPFEGMTMRKVKAESKLPFNDKYAELLKAVVQEHDPQLYDIIQFLYYLYLRPKEVRMLTVDCILLDEMKLRLSGSVAKDKDTIYKSIPKPLLPVMQKYVNYPPHYYIFSKGGSPGNKMLGKNDMCNRMRKYIRQLNLGSRYTLYSWVHTGIKRAAMSNIPIKQLQIQKGHSDLKMFDQYLKDLGVEDCVQLVNNFPVL